MIRCWCVVFAAACGGTERGLLLRDSGDWSGGSSSRVSYHGSPRLGSCWKTGHRHEPDRTASYSHAAESPHSCNSGSWLVTATIDNMSLFDCLVVFLYNFHPIIHGKVHVCECDTISVSMHNQASECTVFLTPAGQCHRYNSVHECEICSNRGHVRGCRKSRLSRSLRSQVCCTLGSNLGQFNP